MEKLKKYKMILLICMILSNFVMLYWNQNIWILPAAIFTIAFFIIWLHENIYGFHAWKEKNKEKIKDDFQIFKEYADEFTTFFSKKK